MYSAQITGIFDEEYVDEDMTESAPKLAKEIAIIMQKWDPDDQLQDSEVENLAKSLVELGCTSVRKLTKLPTSIFEFIMNKMAPMGAQYSLALKQLVENDSPPTQNSVKFVEVDIPSDMDEKWYLKMIPKILFPTQDMVNSFSKELSEAQSAYPPYSPFCVRSPMEVPWRIDSPAHARAWEDEKARQARYNQPNPCPNAAQAVLYRLRIIIAGDIAGAWEKFGGLGAQLGLLAYPLEACVENNAEVTHRLAEEDLCRLAHMARSRADPQEVLSALREPDRGLRSRVIEDQRRAFHLRQAQLGNKQSKGRYRGPSSQQSSAKDSSKDQGSSSNRNPRKRARKSGDGEGRHISIRSPAK